MEVSYTGKEKLKKKGSEAKKSELLIGKFTHGARNADLSPIGRYRHNFTVELGEGEWASFHVNEPNPYAIHLDREICTAKGHILFGTAVLEAQDFIKKTMDLEMEKHKLEEKNDCKK